MRKKLIISAILVLTAITFIFAFRTDLKVKRYKILYSILLAHRPEHIDRYLDYGFDLV
ncbi:MAG: hypothetical protein GX494_12565 [Clostridiaceae bacterium]|nr:hypothetical protein [Clostridiaceae bacterium]